MASSFHRNRERHNPAPDPTMIVANNRLPNIKKTGEDIAASPITASTDGMYQGEPVLVEAVAVAVNDYSDDESYYSSSSHRRPPPCLSKEERQHIYDVLLDRGVSDARNNEERTRTAKKKASSTTSKTKNNSHNSSRSTTSKSVPNSQLKSSKKAVKNLKTPTSPSMKKSPQVKQKASVSDDKSRTSTSSKSSTSNSTPHPPERISKRVLKTVTSTSSPPMKNRSHVKQKPSVSDDQSITSMGSSKARTKIKTVTKKEILPNGTTNEITETQELQADGSMKVVKRTSKTISSGPNLVQTSSPTLPQSPKITTSTTSVYPSSEKPSTTHTSTSNVSYTSTTSTSPSSSPTSSFPGQKRPTKVTTIHRPASKPVNPVSSPSPQYSPSAPNLASVQSQVPSYNQNYRPPAPTSTYGQQPAQYQQFSPPSNMPVPTNAAYGPQVIHPSTQYPANQQSHAFGPQYRPPGPPNAYGQQPVQYQQFSPPPNTTPVPTNATHGPQAVNNWNGQQKPKQFPWGKVAVVGLKVVGAALGGGGG